MDVTRIAWAAGFFDGEGSINIIRQKHAKSGRSHHALLVTVSQTDPRPLQLLAESWGGSICARQSKNAKWKNSWSWAVRSAQAERFLADIRPFLTVKAQEADIALAFREIKANGGRYQGVDVGAYGQREDMKKSLEALRSVDST